MSTDKYFKDKIPIYANIFYQPSDLYKEKYEFSYDFFDFKPYDLIQEKYNEKILRYSIYELTNLEQIKFEFDPRKMLNAILSSVYAKMAIYMRTRLYEKPETINLTQLYNLLPVTESRTYHYLSKILTSKNLKEYKDDIFCITTTKNQYNITTHYPKLLANMLINLKNLLTYPSKSEYMVKQSYIKNLNFFTNCANAIKNDSPLFKLEELFLLENCSNFLLRQSAIKGLSQYLYNLKPNTDEFYLKFFYLYLEISLVNCYFVRPYIMDFYSQNYNSFEGKSKENLHDAVYLLADKLNDIGNELYYYLKLLVEHYYKIDPETTREIFENEFSAEKCIKIPEELVESYVNLNLTRKYEEVYNYI